MYSYEVSSLPAVAERGRLSVFADWEDEVPRTTGPTIARWQLAVELKRLREAAGITHVEIAEVLGCSDSKIYKIESGDVGVGRGDMLVMLDQYQLRDDRVRTTLLDLQKQGRERGWWAKYGQLPNAYSMYIGLESAATEIKSFELAVVPGLLQTEDYARAVIDVQRQDDMPAERDRRVRVRLARQDCLTEDPPVQYWAIIDEGALRRQTGGKAVMRAQLEHLITVGELANVTIQVVPFTEGSHPGTLGSITILEFPEDVHSPVAYIETFAGDVYLEREDELRRATLVYTHLHAAALSESKSRDLIAAIAKSMA
jgi:transcriptional regulator with XRE-family HTH domain